MGWRIGHGKFQMEPDVMRSPSKTKACGGQVDIKQKIIILALFVLNKHIVTRCKFDIIDY